MGRCDYAVGQAWRGLRGPDPGLGQGKNWSFPSHLQSR